MPLPEAVTALAPIKTRRPPIGKLIVPAAFVLAFIIAGVFVVLELNKGTLWIRRSQLSNVDERDIVGTVRRGPDSTLLLDITGSPKFPDCKKVLGIVLSTARVPGTEVPDDKVESTGQDAIGSAKLAVKVVVDRKSTLRSANS